MSTDRQSWYPPVGPSPTPEETALHLRLLYTALNDHDQAIGQLANRPSQTVNNTTVINSGGGGGGGGGQVVGGVNDQIGVNAYTTQQSDYGVKILLGDSSGVSVTLSPGITTPWFTFIGNDSSGMVNLAAGAGSTLQGQNYIAPGCYGIVFFDGSTFWSEGVPIAMDSSLGIVRPDNATLTVNSGVLSTLGASGTIHIPSIDSGMTGSITVVDGLITAFANPT